MEKTLFAGISFNRRRFAKDFTIFEKKTTAEVDEVAPSSTAPQVADSNRESSMSHEKSKQNKKKRRDIADAGRIEMETGAGISVFSSKKQRAQFGATDVKHAERDPQQSEATALLRKQFRIRVTGQDVPPPLKDFKQLKTQFGCQNRLLIRLAEAGYVDPTPIQRQVITVLLKGRECFACAPTGSGKTMSFLIPIVATLKSRGEGGVRAVILCPTRELALQTQRELKKLTGGVRLRSRVMTKAATKPQTFDNGQCDVLISTPLRLNHMLSEGGIDLSSVQHLVLDESDKLLEMGFVEQIDAVIAACTNPSVVRSLFSATLPETVEELARSVMHDPIRVVVGERNVAVSSVKQRLLFVGSEQGKLLAIRQMLGEGLQPPVLIFVQSKERAKDLYKQIAYDGINVDTIHADRSQAQREAVVTSFREGKTWVLIATDVMARGMDFKGVNLVINYDFPPNAACYIHRIGRSGRAGREGEAVTLYTEEDAPMLKPIANVMVASGNDVPSWMLSLRKQRMKRLHVPKRKAIDAASKYEEYQKKRKREMIEASKRRVKKMQAEA